MKKGSGKSAPFPGLNLSADSLCMCHRNDLLESDTTDYYVLEARPSIWHYAGIFLVVSSIYHDWKIWKHLRYLKHSMVSMSLFVNVVADILANHNREYLYGFKEFYLYFSKTSAMRSICRALILQKQPAFLQSAQSLHNLREKIKNWKSIQISYTDAYFVHFGKIKRGANERAVFL